MRNRYLARSRPDSWPHDRRWARRAASTALSTSAGVARATFGERLLRGRVDRDERVASGGGHEPAVDEQAVALLERDDVARLGCRRVLPRDRLPVAQAPAVGGALGRRDHARAAPAGHARHYGTGRLRALTSRRLPSPVRSARERLELGQGRRVRAGARAAQGRRARRPPARIRRPGPWTRARHGHDLRRSRTPGIRRRTRRLRPPCRRRPRAGRRPTPGPTGSGSRRRRCHGCAGRPATPMSSRRSIIASGSSSGARKRRSSSLTLTTSARPAMRSIRARNVAGSGVADGRQLGSSITSRLGVGLPDQSLDRRADRLQDQSQRPDVERAVPAAAMTASASASVSPAADVPST